MNIYNFVCINMFLYDVLYEKFNFVYGDILIDLVYWDDEFFEVIVFNLFYFINWEGDVNLFLINDLCFVVVGVFVLKLKVDFVFMMYILLWFVVNGMVVIVEFLGVMYWGGVE